MFSFRYVQTIQARRLGPRSTRCGISPAMRRSNRPSLQASLSHLMKLTGLEVHPLDYGQVASALLSDKVIGWVQVNCEIRPRALGNRSILAAPFDSQRQPMSV
ncbi:carbamoyltransferase C-terminal domain-containing protein [Mesorhizobium sp. ZC-5]|uniref:carbamoyltransferase C-terminal domain-containing protein n=2 Tax=Phyllobacteriaceae TaxID=69277 RepID=UPI003993E442